MAKSRNERRKLAKERLIAKSVRIANASEAARLEVNRKIVSLNMNQPKPSATVMKVDAVLSSNMGGYAGQSHRGYVSAASGSMSKRSTLQVMSKAANKAGYDRYARAESGDRSSWPVVQK